MLRGLDASGGKYEAPQAPSECARKSAKRFS
jgi:hypothetical protein